MMKPRLIYGGLICECPVCQKTFFISDVDVWVYKREVNAKKYKSTMVYFDRYSCKRMYDKAYDAVIEQRKRESAIKRHKGKPRKNKKVSDYIAGKTCGICRYCREVEFGFHDCSVKGWSVSPLKTACCVWKPKEEKICTKN